jgi:hypothetical protein
LRLRVPAEIASSGFDVRVRKVLPDEEKRVAGELGRRIAQAVSEVQGCRMPPMLLAEGHRHYAEIAKEAIQEGLRLPGVPTAPSPLP